MMKICLISPLVYKLFYPADEKVLPFGGSEAQQYQLGTELVKDKNFEVSFIAGDFYAEQPEIQDFWLKNGIIAKIKIYKVFRYYNRIPLLSALSDIWDLYQAMKASQADIFLIRGGGALAGKTALLAKRILGKKFIFSSAHDRESDLIFFKNSGVIYKTLFRYALNKADLIICQHNEQKAAFKKSFGLESVVIKTMYQIGELDKIKIREYILWVGRLEKWKQPELFCNLAKEMPEEKFLLITNSNADTFKKEFGHIKNLEIKEKAPFNEMDDYFAKAKVFINTSLWEGFPNTFAQATKNGTPIISLEVNPDNILEKYRIGECANGNFKKLTDDLAMVLNGQNLREKLSENAYIYAKEHHDIGKVIGNYKSIFFAIN